MGEGIADGVGIGLGDGCVTSDVPPAAAVGVCEAGSFAAGDGEWLPAGEGAEAEPGDEHAMAPTNIKGSSHLMR